MAGPESHLGVARLGPTGPLRAQCVAWHRQVQADPPVLRMENFLSAGCLIAARSEFMRTSRWSTSNAWRRRGLPSPRWE